MNKTRVKQINHYAKENHLDKSQRRRIKKLYNRTDKAGQAVIRAQMS